MCVDSYCACSCACVQSLAWARGCLLQTRAHARTHISSRAAALCMQKYPASGRRVGWRRGPFKGKKTKLAGNLFLFLEEKDTVRGLSHFLICQFFPSLCVTEIPTYKSRLSLFSLSPLSVPDPIVEPLHFLSEAGVLSLSLSLSLSLLLSLCSLLPSILMAPIPLDKHCSLVDRVATKSNE